MAGEKTNILKESSSTVKFQAVEDVHCGGQMVSLKKFRKEVGNRLVLPNSNLRAPHIKSYTRPPPIKDTLEIEIVYCRISTSRSPS